MCTHSVPHALIIRCGNGNTATDAMPKKDTIYPKNVHKIFGGILAIRLSVILVYVFDSVYVFPGFLLQQHKHLLASDVHSAVKPKPKMQCQYPPSPSTGSIAKAAKKNQPG